MTFYNDHNKRVCEHMSSASPTNLAEIKAKGCPVCLMQRKRDEATLEKIKPRNDYIVDAKYVGHKHDVFKRGFFYVLHVRVSEGGSYIVVEGGKTAVGVINYDSREVLLDDWEKIIIAKKEK